MAAKKPAAKRGASRYQAPAKPPIPGWVWLACGLLIGAFVVFLMKLEPGRGEIKRVKEEVTRPANNPAAKPQTNSPTPSAATAKPKYDFYTLLPESEVIVPMDAPAEKPPAALTPEELAKADAARALAALSGQTPPPLPAASDAAVTPPATLAKAPLSTQFFLQAGSFRKQADADKVRAQIIMLGQSVQVESGNVREETWYRVLVGPFASREQLTQAQKSLAAGGFSNLLLQQRQSR
ncbi:MAG: SPOR domain-containing protein [Pseudomonas sp.]|uniref:SPOR domain-containing protein n=1 Tax=Pseudomonas sp. TaxID=306 RepID=UPI0027373A93|nr:SPOR domain-containing protein [Pseudomonas sp.]MDP3845731.1 SPOR domain-containing protein [Pseudomonas sp.]